MNAPNSRETTNLLHEEPSAGGRKKGAQLPNKNSIGISLVTPTGGYMVGGQIQGHAIALLIDTGAAVTLVRKDAWDMVSKD